MGGSRVVSVSHLCHRTVNPQFLYRFPPCVQEERGVNFNMSASNIKNDSLATYSTEHLGNMSENMELPSIVGRKWFQSLENENNGYVWTVKGNSKLYECLSSRSKLEPVHNSKLTACSEGLGSPFSFQRWEASTGLWGYAVWGALLQSPSNWVESWLGPFLLTLGLCSCHSKTNTIEPEAQAAVLGVGTLGWDSISW